MRKVKVKTVQCSIFGSQLAIAKVRVGTHIHLYLWRDHTGPLPSRAVKNPDSPPSSSIQRPLQFLCSMDSQDLCLLELRMESCQISHLGSSVHPTRGMLIPKMMTLGVGTSSTHRWMEDLSPLGPLLQGQALPRYSHLGKGNLGEEDYLRCSLF